MSRWCPNPACVKAAKSLRTRIDGGVQRVRRAGFGAKVERFTFFDVYYRDSGTCYLCGVRTLNAPEGREAASPTLDHVVPVQHGGDHTMANVRLAHMACNMAKNSRTEQEARQLLSERPALAVSSGEPLSVPISVVVTEHLSRVAVAPRGPGGRPLVDVLPVVAP